jgi:outer membrane protein assembly factor BamB
MTRARLLWWVAIPVLVVVVVGCTVIWRDVVGYGYGQQIEGPAGSTSPPYTAGAPTDPWTLAGTFDEDALVADGLLIAFGDPETGIDAYRMGPYSVDTEQPFWQYTRPGHTIDYVDRAGQDLYVLWDDGLLVRFDVGRGRPVWSTQLSALGSSATGASPLVTLAGGARPTVVLVESRASIHAVAVDGGSPRWTTPAPRGCLFGSVGGPPAASAGMTTVVIAGCSPASVQSLGDVALGVDDGTGAIRWRRSVPEGNDLAGYISGVSPVDQDHVVGWVAGYQSYVIDAATGAMTDHQVPTSTVADGIGVGVGQLMSTTNYGSGPLIGTDATTGRVLWSTRAPAPIDGLSDPLIAQGHVYVVGMLADPVQKGWDDYDLLVFDLRTGALLSSSAIPDPAAGAVGLEPVEAGSGVVVVGSPASQTSGYFFSMLFGPPFGPNAP